MTEILRNDLLVTWLSVAGARPPVRRRMMSHRPGSAAPGYFALQRPDGCECPTAVWPAAGSYLPQGPQGAPRICGAAKAPGIADAGGEGAACCPAKNGSLATSLKAVLCAVTVIWGSVLATSGAVAQIAGGSDLATDVAAPGTGTVWNLGGDVVMSGQVTLPGGSPGLTINGNGHSVTLTSPTPDTPPNGRFYWYEAYPADGTSIRLSLSDVTITGGNQTGYTSSSEATGAAVHVEVPLTVNISGAVTLSNNIGYAGGAIDIARELLLDGAAGSIISLVNNSATLSTTSVGGAVNAGSVVINGSAIIISGNTARGAGGAINASGTTSGTTLPNVSIGNADGSTSVVTLTDNHSLSNTGGAIKATHTAVTIRAGTVDISGNSSNGYGGAIWSSRSQSLGGAGIVIDGNTITIDSNKANNSSGTNSPGGAIYSTSTVAIGNDNSIVRLTNNSSVGGGGAIYTSDVVSAATNVSINGSEIDISGNKTSSGTITNPGNGGAIQADAAVTIGNSASVVRIDDNAGGSGSGGAIYSDTVAVSGSDITLSGNAVGNMGGAIFAKSTVVIGNADGSSGSVSITNNNSAVSGGAISANGAVTVLGSDIAITGNKAGTAGGSNLGGAINSNSAVTIGDAVSTVNIDSNINYSGRGGAIFGNNVAVAGSDVTLSGNSTTNDGGAVYGMSAVVIGNADGSSDNVTITGNKATDGGAVYSDTAVTVLGRNITISGNDSAGSGAIYAVDVNIGNADGSSSLMLAGNKAMNGGVIFSEGATTLTGHGQITGNSATGLGGAILAFGNVTLTAAGGDLTFSGNVANGAPNAIWSESADAATDAPLATTATLNAKSGNLVFYDPIANNVASGLLTVVTSGPGAVIFDGARNANVSDIYGNTTVDSGTFAVRNGAVYGVLADDVGADLATRFTVNPGATLAGGIQGEIRADNVMLDGSLDISGSTALKPPAGTAAGGHSNFIITSSNVSFGAGSRVLFNSYLNDGSGQLTDLLTLNLQGTATSGTAGVFVTNTGGFGAQTTGNGIQLVQTNDGISTGAFTLGARVAAGVWNYELFQGGVGSDAGSQNWYLRSTAVRPEVPPDVVEPAVADRLAVAMLATLVNRDLSFARVCADDTKSHSPLDNTAVSGCSTLLWGRVLGASGAMGGGVGSGNLGFGSNGPAYSFDYGGFEAGADLYRTSRDTAGFYAGATTLRGDAYNADGSAAGHLTMDAYGLGGYWAHKAIGGWYSDLVVQATRYDNVTSRSVSGVSFGTAGWGVTASAETGDRIVVGSGFSVTPQGQLIYQHSALDASADRYGRISFAATDEVYARLGARLSRDWLTTAGRNVTTFAETSFWHQFGPDARTTFASTDGANPTVVSATLGGTWSQFRLGISGQVTHGVSVFASGDYDISLDSTHGHSLGGQAGVSVAW